LYGLKASQGFTILACEGQRRRWHRQGL